MPIHITLGPGCSSDLRPKKPPNLAIIKMISLNLGVLLGGGNYIN